MRLRRGASRGLIRSGALHVPLVPQQEPWWEEQWQLQQVCGTSQHMHQHIHSPACISGAAQGRWKAHPLSNDGQVFSKKATHTAVTSTCYLLLTPLQACPSPWQVQQWGL
jgi:hypothetical protein